MRSFGLTFLPLTQRAGGGQAYEVTHPPARTGARLAQMIEETGRHAGQMDIIRERIDGATGR